MKFKVPFTIEYPNKKDFVLSKIYEEKTESYLLKIPAHKKVEKAIILKISPTAQDLNFKLTIHLEEGASATFVEGWSTEVQAESIQYTHHLVCENTSDLKYIVLNHVSDKTDLKEERSSQVASDAKCHLYAYHFGGKKVESKILQEATGRRAEINTDLVAKSTQSQDLSFKCEQLYSSPKGSGEISMKGIAEDKALLNFDGMINIAQSGSGSSGHLQQETLNLSPYTIVKATPGLKIDTNQVKAGHGASIRNLNEEDFYYFAARGISKEEAKHLLVTGFLGAELNKIKELPEAHSRAKAMI